MISRTLLAIGLVGLTVGSAQSAAPGLRDLLKGTYHVTVQGNNVATITIMPGGKVSGVQPNGDKDTGKWWINGNEKVCVQFKKWLDKAPHCSSLSTDNTGTVRGDGFSAHR